MQCKRCQRFGHTQRNCPYAPRCVACGDAHPSGSCATPKQQLKCCSSGGKYTAKYRGCSKWKEAKATAAKRSEGDRGRKDGVSTRLPAPAKPSLDQENLGPGWNHVVRGGRVVKAAAMRNSAPTPSEAIARTERQAVSKGGRANPARPVVPVANPTAPAPKETDPTSPKGQSPLQDILDILETLSPRVCVELTRCLLDAIPSLISGEARSRAILKIVLFISEYGCAA
jgi:hypothetical protein